MGGEEAAGRGRGVTGAVGDQHAWLNGRPVYCATCDRHLTELEVEKGSCLCGDERIKFGLRKKACSPTRSALLVVFDEELDEEVSDCLIAAIQMLRRVISVGPAPVDSVAMIIAREQVKHKLRNEMRDVLWPRS